MSKTNSLKNNLDSLKSRVSNLSKNDVTIVAVSKYSEFADIKTLYDHGHRDFGENRIEELQKKAELADEHGMNDISWHFIGRIQSKKIKQIVGVSNLKYVHSIANEKHLNLFLSETEKQKKTLKCFLQVNYSGEEHKDGFDHLDTKILNSFTGNQYLSFFGLMTMAQNRSDVDDKVINNTFMKLRTLRDQIDAKLKLSMGMSGDFELALSHDATFIRVGSHIFKS